MLSLKDFKEYSLKMDANDLIRGGIACGNVYHVVAHLHNEGNEQLGNLCGQTIQCTESQGGVTVNSSVQMADDCCSYC